MTTLAIEGLTAGYGTMSILQSVSLQLEAGEILAIVGANGAGKSTLLRTISGLVRSRSGSILLDNRDIAKATPEAIVRLGLAHVPEGRGIFTSLTVLENLMLGASGQRRATTGASGVTPFNIVAAYDLFPIIYERRNEWAGNLSGGEQQMLSIARALMASPGIVMIDEPSLGLAPLIVDQVYNTLLSLRATHGIGVIVVEQSIQRATAAADRVLLMTNGELAPLDQGLARAGRHEMTRAYFGISDKAVSP